MLQRQRQALGRTQRQPAVNPQEEVAGRHLFEDLVNHRIAMIDSDWEARKGIQRLGLGENENGDQPEQWAGLSSPTPLAEPRPLNEGLDKTRRQE